MLPDTLQSRRHSIRYPGYDYAQPGAYFVTIVTYHRECIFGQIVFKKIHLSPLGQIIGDLWEQIPMHFVNIEVEPFVIMPNHIHGIITIKDCRGTIYRAPTADNHHDYLERFGNPVPGSLSTIIRTYKAAVSRLAKKKLGITNIWQRNYYEHIIRNQSEMEKIGQYILTNPDQWADDLENISELTRRTQK